MKRWIDDIKRHLRMHAILLPFALLGAIVIVEFHAPHWMIYVAAGGGVIANLSRRKS